MKIKVPPRNPAPQGQTIIIKEQREGCFLRTLNFGCAVVVLVVVGVVALLAWAPLSSGFRKGREMARQHAAAPSAPAPAAPSSGEALHADADPEATDRYRFRELKDAMTDAARYIFTWKSERSL